MADLLFTPEQIERARNADILDLARRSGARLKRVTAAEWAGPCPECGGTDRFSVNTKRRVFNCRGALGGDVIGMTQHVLGLDFVDALAFIGGERDEIVTIAPAPPELPSANSVTTTTADALAVWDASIDPRGTPAEVYLNGRALVLGDDIAHQVLRWNPRIGALVALFRNISTDAPQAVSRIFLRRDGSKRERKFLGPVGGAAVKLDPDDAVTMGLHVGEGIETCLAARQLGLKPSWALGSTNNITGFPVLSGVECLTILAEHDQASQKATQACGTRWHAAGREVLINQPIAGKDLNDAIRGVA
jgi:hypothetical protein